MSKLIKLTTTLDKVRDTNGYLCISDNDIILEPNAKVSLLNAHISSGVVANYKIDGADSLGQTPSGQIIGNIQLGDATDRQRDVIIPNGTYDINPLMDTLNDAMNESFVFKSTTKYPDATSTTLNLPADQDFGIATQTSITGDNKAKISFNNAKQKYTADIKYTNKSAGVQVNAGTGAVSFVTPTGNFQVGLLPALQSQPYVYTEDNIGSGIAVFDAVTLVETARGVYQNLTVKSITASGSSLDTAMDLDPTKTVIGDPAEFTTTGFYTNTIPYNVGDNVTLDDGTGLPFAPSAVRAYGKVATADLVLANDNTFVTQLQGEQLKEAFLKFDIASYQATGITNEYNLVLDTPFAGAVNLKLTAGNVHWITNKADIRYACLQISAIKDNGGKLEITALVSKVDTTTPLDPNEFNQVVNAQVIYSINGKTNVANSYLQEGTLGLFDKNYNLLARFNLEGPPTLVQDLSIITSAVFSYQWVLIAGSWNSNNPNSPAPAELNGLDALVEFTRLTYGSGTFDISTCFLTNTDRVINASNTVNTTFSQADNFIIFEQGLVNQTAVTMSAPKVVFDNYEIYPIQFPANDIFPTYANFFKIFLAGNASIWTMVKNNVNQFMRLRIQTLTGPTVPVTNALTRIFIGTDIRLTQRVELNFTSPSQSFKSTKYDLMVKGPNIVGQENAFALGDDRLTHSCGRVAFKVLSAKIGSKFGIMAENANFNSLYPGMADLIIQTASSSGGSAIPVVYRLYRGSAQIGMKGELEAQDGDTVIIQWGVTGNITDFEYSDAVTSATTQGQVRRNIATISNQVSIDANTYDFDRNKILITVIRNGDLSRYMHFGSAFSLPAQGTPITGDQDRMAKVLPWTPRNNPYLAPQYWNKGDFRVFIAPNQGIISTLELTPSPALVTDPLTGALNVFDGSNHIYHPDLHGSSNLELQDQPADKFGSFASTFIFNFTDPAFQNQLGYKTNTKTVPGLSGSWIADIEYLRAYLPEGLVILLENLGVDTFDCGQLTGSRRNIIATCINTQQKLGDISVEPSNLYRIAIGNKTPINLRKFALAFEDLYGKQLILASAKVCVSLLFEN